MIIEMRKATFYAKIDTEKSDTSQVPLPLKQQQAYDQAKAMLADSPLSINEALTILKSAFDTVEVQRWI